MTLKSTLESAKARLDALLTYANETTGGSDTSIGDAIQTLCAGYGGGVDHTIEDALITNTPMDEYYNDRVTSIGNVSQRQDVFGATQIKKISFPNATACPAQYAFHGRNVSVLEELYLPRMQTSGYGCMENNPNLKICDFGFSFGGAKCRYCPNLEVLIIRDVALKNVGNGWLTGCTKALPDGSGCYVYVPQKLLSQYQASTAWQTYANVLEFRAIEGSEYEISE